MFGLVAQFLSSVVLPSITRTVLILVFAALALGQAVAVRASIADSLDDQRFCVLVPSVSSTITLSLSGAGSDPSGSGRVEVSECQPKTRPMVTLVLPDAAMASILLLRLVQPVVSSTSVSGINDASWPH